MITTDFLPTRLNVDALIFDFDGVLVDSVDVKTRAYKKIFEPYGSDVVRKVEAHHLENGGMSRFEKFRIYYKDFLGELLSQQELDKLTEKFSRLVVDEVLASKEIEGVSKFLDKHSSSTPCFVNSGTPVEELKLIVRRRGWLKYFKEILGAPCSKKDNLRYVFDKFQFAPDRCLFFGDARSDYEAAAAFGVPFLAISKNADDSLIVFDPHVQRMRDFLEVEKWFVGNNYILH